MPRTIASRAATLTALALVAGGCQSGAAPTAPGASASPAVSPVSPAVSVRPTAPPGEWRAVAGLPEACGARVAVEPAAAVPPLAWRGCASGRGGCAVFEATWGARGDGLRFRPGALEPVFEDADGVHLAYLRRDADHTLSIVQALDGAAEAAWRSPERGCLVVAAASRHGLAARAIVPDEARAGGAPHYLGAAPRGAPVALTMTPAALDPRLPLSQSVARGATTLTIEAVGAGGGVRGAAFSIARGAFVPGAADGEPAVERPLPVEGGMIALAATVPSSLVWVSDAGARRALVTPSAGHHVTWFALDRARADAVVWTEASIDGASPASLWVAPLAPGGVLGPARRVADVPADRPFVANAGVVAIVEAPDRARVLRLSDGASAALWREPDLAWTEPLWVNDEAAWFVVTDLEPHEAGFPARAGLVRVARPPLAPR